MLYVVHRLRVEALCSPILMGASDFHCHGNATLFQEGGTKQIHERLPTQPHLPLTLFSPRKILLAILLSFRSVPMALETQTLEARFEQIAIVDQNDDPALLSTSYHKSKVR